MFQEVEFDDKQHSVTSELSAPGPSFSNELSHSQKHKNGVIKKRGRPPKGKPDYNVDDIPLKQTKVTDSMKKAKRQINRFKGVTKEELLQRLLPDRIKHGLDILIIGINPGLFAAYKGHHYAGPGNHFWNCVNMSGLVEKPTSSENDIELLDYGIGFSTMVKRTTPSAKDLSSQEIREGGKELIEKIKTYQPKIAVFNGKGIYEIFSKEMFGQKKKDFSFGRQPNTIPGTNTLIFVMPSSSARCAQFPRAQDKVHYFIQIKKLRDEVNGVTPNDDVQETNYAFDLAKATEQVRSGKVKQEVPDPSYDLQNSSTFQQPQCSKSLPSAKKSSANGGKNQQKPAENVASHPHLVKFLCQNETSKAASSSTSSTLRSPLRHLQEVVSEEMRNERVGRWIRTQINQDYGNELPMGYEERLRLGEVPDQSESDQGSQQSMISAGVSGSTSAGSTSGYGSADSHPHRARQDMVEMWVREQQYVRHHSVPQPPRLADLGHEPSTSALSADRLNGSTLRPGLPSIPSDDILRPPVPLYSSWGEVRPEFIGHVSDVNSSNSGLVNHDQSQLSIHPQIP